MKSCLTAVVLLVLFYTIPLSAQKSGKLTLKTIFRSEHNVPINSGSESSVWILNSTVNFQNLQNVSEVIIENFPVSNSQTADVKLSLTKSIIDPTTQITVGNKVNMNLPILSRFNGHIIGDEHSEVLVTLIDNTIYSRIKQSNGEVFTLTPANSKEYILTDSKQNVSNMPISCNSVEPINLGSDMIKDKSSKVLSNTTLQVDIALDICKEWYLWKFAGDTVKIRDYILSVYSMVSYLYEKEMNVTIHIPFLNIWTTTDPYDTETAWLDYGPNPATILSNIPSYWKSNNLNVKANIVHAITVGKIGGGGGVANYDAFSRDIHSGDKYGPFAGISLTAWNYPLSVKPTLNFDFDIHTIAHELGHNFNCPHTHSCSWNPPIDTCVVYDGGNDGCPASGNKRICTQFTQTSIMSYCREINNWVSNMNFLSKPAELIRTYAEKYLKEANTDITKPASPSLISPIESNQSVPLVTGFKWLKNSVALRYHFQLSKSNQFDTLVTDTNIVFDTLTIAGLEEATDYRWRVAAVNHSGEGEFSAYRQFKTLSEIDFLQPEVATNLDDDELDFKNVTVGTTKEMNFNVIAGNVVDLPLDSISFLGDVGSFSIKSISKSLPTVLTKNDTAVVTVAFKPTKDDTDASTILKISFHDKEKMSQTKFIDVKGNATLTGVNENDMTNDCDLALSILPNPLTNIGVTKYQLKGMQEVRLSLYNTLGKEVAVLFKGVAESGEHTLTLNSDMLPTGIYQVVLRTNSSMTTLPIAVIK